MRYMDPPCPILLTFKDVDSSFLDGELARRVLVGDAESPDQPYNCQIARDQDFLDLRSIIQKCSSGVFPGQPLVAYTLRHNSCQVAPDNWPPNRERTIRIPQGCL